jgi:prophage regulatory protein
MDAARKRQAHPAPEALPRNGYSRERVVLKFFPFSRATLWRMTREGKFPSPVKLSEGITAWENEKLWQVIDAGGKWEANV